MQQKATSPHIVLIIGGGIAAYKSLELIRLLRKADMTVTPVLTRAGARFVTPLSAAALAGEPAHEDLFSTEDEARMRHIELARRADVLVVAPATADLMARAAAGMADDLATTLLLATRAPVLMAPAMNTAMWEHPATRRNHARLAADGVRFVGPEAGDLACGEEGAGRMAEPETIIAVIQDILKHRLGHGPLAGVHVLVTAGPTHEPIDPVRYIGNRSSGRQGFAIARAAAEMGGRVTLVSGPVALDCSPGVYCIRVQTAEEMLKAVLEALPADIAVFAAAVADWRPETAAADKLKKSERPAPPTIRLVENPDILATVGHLKQNRPTLVVGFAAETGDPVAAAREKLARKGADLIVANDVSPSRNIFGGEENEIILVRQDGVETWPRLPKTEVARHLMAVLAKEWRQRKKID